jgi:hypothetical protein
VPLNASESVSERRGGAHWHTVTGIQSEWRFGAGRAAVLVPQASTRTGHWHLLVEASSGSLGAGLAGELYAGVPRPAVTHTISQQSLLAVLAPAWHWLAGWQALGWRWDRSRMKERKERGRGGTRGGGKESVSKFGTQRCLVYWQETTATKAARRRPP